MDGGVATLASGFTVTARPTIVSLSPSSRSRGLNNQVIIVTGTGFVSGATVAFSGSGISLDFVTWNSSTQLTIRIDITGGASTGSRNVTVTNPDGGTFTRNAGFTVL
jgi:hypothetical protein